MNTFEWIEKYMELGCRNRGKCAVAYRCMLQLQATTAGASARCLYDAELQELYAIVDGAPPPGSGDTKAAPKIYLPMQSADSIDMIAIERAQRRLLQLHPEVAAISLALIDASGMTIYYRLTGGFREKQRTE